jgi:HlyD family secretion protein
MLNVDPTLRTLSLTGVAAIAISLLLTSAMPSLAQELSAISKAVAQDDAMAAPKPSWAASSTGRIEPKDGDVRIDTQVPGRIVEVAVKTNAAVQAGDLLVRVDDEDLFAKYTSAEAEVQVRERERDDEPAKGAELERRKVEDAVASAERGLFRARQAFDESQRSVRNAKGSADEVAKARTNLSSAKDRVITERAALATVTAKADMPLPTRLESALTQARADLLQIEQAIERTRVRAPSDGSMLNVWAKVGETAELSPETVLVLFGDISSLRVRAEVEERDAVKVHVGQKVVVRADAYPGRDFEGTVTSLAPALGPPRILSRGPRRPNDVEVLEVLASIDGQPVLLSGMRVDVFFKLDNSANAAKPN